MAEHRIVSLGNAAAVQMEHLLPNGHSQLLEQTVARLHLALTYTDALSPLDTALYARPIADCLVRAFAVGQNDLSSRLDSDSSISFVISYPRSGNTVLTGTLAHLLQAQIFEGFPHSLIPFSKSIYPRHYPLVRLIKDHVARLEYLNDKTVILIRDGRDTMISLAYMTFSHGRHNFSKRNQLSLFIQWLEKEYEFLGWASHMRMAETLLTGPDKILVRYEDFMADYHAFEKIADFVDPSHGNSNELTRRRYDERSQIFDAIGRNPHSRAAWGIGEQFDQDSLFYDWSHNRQVSHWKNAWDDEAKVAFHETGATEFLLRYGYESDADWWRSSRNPQQAHGRLTGK
jgi:Sulfotransferase domain